MSLEVRVRVKEEPVWDKDSICGVSEAAAQAGLYPNHKVKDELVLGPEVLHLPHVHVHIKEEGGYPQDVKCIKQELKSLKKEPVWENHMSLHIINDSPNPQARSFKVRDELGLELQPSDKTASVRAPIKEESVCLKDTKCLKEESEWENNSSLHDVDAAVSIDTHKNKLGQELQQPEASDKVIGSKSSPVATTHKESTQRPKTKNNYCEICNIEFTKWSSLNRHKRRHTNTFHICKLCKKEFTRLDHLQNHMHTHTGLKPHSCGSCEKKFTQLSNLKRHERLHKGIKPFLCEVCKKEFTLLSHLNDHKLLHSGMKNHVCEICQKGFTLLSDLKRHKKRHFPKKAM